MTTEISQEAWTVASGPNLSGEHPKRAFHGDHRASIVMPQESVRISQPGSPYSRQGAQYPGTRFSVPVEPKALACDPRLTMERAPTGRPGP
jgi:hypothetical protein